jgi:hypothetical protein
VACPYVDSVLSAWLVLQSHKAVCADYALSTKRQAIGRKEKKTQKTTHHKPVGQHITTTLT